MFNLSLKGPKSYKQLLWHLSTASDSVRGNVKFSLELQDLITGVNPTNYRPTSELRGNEFRSKASILLLPPWRRILITTFISNEITNSSQFLFYFFC